LPHSRNRARLAQAAITLAHREAEKAVKRGLAAKGIKLQYVAKREIVTLAKDYLAEHPHMLRTVFVIEAWPWEP